ncbi:hypothetical protein [Sulfurovum mangrovi]|uniref:hypothetical protein n=1 Tax=Sulfurovum mangrovi TaxID=2893889 RepID=UPI001E33C6B4|nr:hypothetical protein [Sulfurovum mangrovi]UFH58856.1 hypothetical protein LN246_10955 [Sulfurovum mangrovi]
MKNLLMIFTFLLSVVLTGCGSNSKPDGTSDSNGSVIITTTNYSLVAVPDVIDIAALGETRTLKLYLNDNDALAPVEGEVIRAKVFDQNFGTLNTYTLTTDANGYVGFIYSAPDTELPNQSLVITFELENSVPVVDKNVTINFNGSTVIIGDELNTTNYQLVAVPDVLDVTAGGETANIDLYLNDTSVFSPVSGVVIKAQVFDQTNGTLNTYEVTTDSNGHAPFVYTAPNILPASSLVITYEIKDGTPALTKDVTVNFTGSTPVGKDVNTTGYELVAVPDIVEVTQEGETANIDLYLNDMVNLVPVSDVLIKAQVFDQTNGTLNTYEVATDSNGHAPFVYTAPNTLPAISLVITFEVKAGTPALTKDVTVDFNGSTTVGIDVNTTGYELVAVPGSMNILEAGESRTLAVYLSNMVTQSPVPNQTIKALWFDPNSGTLNSYFATTNSNGQAVFNYTAPLNLGGLSDFNITFEVLDGTPTLDTNMTVYFGTSSGTTVDTTDMQLWVVPDEFNITEVGQSRAIDLYLEENSTHIPLEGTEIAAEFFDPANGTLNTYIGTTDTNGHVTFNYTAPETLPSGSLIITFKVLHGQPDLSVSTTVNFIGGQTIDTTNMNLYVTLPSIDANATVPEATEDIDIWVENSVTNTPLEGIEVRAIFFDPNYGSLDKYTDQTDVNGHIVFTYMGPEANPGSDLNISFEIVNGSPTKTVDVLLDF